MNKLFFTLLTSCIFLPSCTSKLEKKVADLTEENQLLKDSLESLQTDLACYQLNPEKLYSNVQTLYDQGSIDSIRAIQSILEKYHPEAKQTGMVKALIEKFEAEKAEKAAAEKKARMKAVSKLKKNYDDINHTTWYYNPYFTHYNNVNRTSLYIGHKDGYTWLRLKMSYEGEDWIFFESAYLSYDGETYEVYFDKYREKESDNDSRVWEWIDVSVDESMLAFLQKMVHGKSVKMRLSGKYTHTRNLTSTEIKALKDVLLAYDVLKAEDAKNGVASE